MKIIIKRNSDVGILGDLKNTNFFLNIQFTTSIFELQSYVYLSFIPITTQYVKCL